MKVEQMVQWLRRFPGDAEVVRAGVDDNGEDRYLIDMTQSSIVGQLSRGSGHDGDTDDDYEPDETLCWLDCPTSQLPQPLRAAAERDEA